MDNSNRPLSPHLQIYKLPLTAVISITHRFTGTMLCLGMAGFTASLLIVSTGAENFARLQSFLENTPVKLLLVAFVYLLLFHWCHGMRHLIMDAGKSLDKADLARYALLELALSAILTAGTAIFFLAG